VLVQKSRRKGTAKRKRKYPRKKKKDMAMACPIFFVQTSVGQLENIPASRTADEWNSRNGRAMGKKRARMHTWTLQKRGWRARVAATPARSAGRSTGAARPNTDTMWQRKCGSRNSRPVGLTGSSSPTELSAPTPSPSRPPPAGSLLPSSIAAAAAVSMDNARFRSVPLAPAPGSIAPVE